MEKVDRQSVCQESQFDLVYQEQVKPLYHFIYYKCGDQALAEDIVQEAFLKLWENCSKVRKDQAKSYLFTVARNLFLNKISRKKVALKFIQQLSNTQERENPETILRQKEFQDQLQAAINQLPENQQIVFLLSRIDKMKYREIAELLEISQKAVEKRMHKALLSLRALHKNI